MSQPTEQELYTLQGLAAQASNAASDPLQVLQHLQSNMGALQHQFENMQSTVQAQVESLTTGQAPLMSIQAAIEAISSQCRDTMQANHTVLNGMNSVLNGLAQRPVNGIRPRPPVPMPLTPKYTGNDKDMSLSDFKAKLKNTFARFPESLAEESAKVHYALNSSDGPAFSYFAAILNGEAVDEENILQDFDSYIDVLDRLYGNKNKVHAVESKLSHLRQNGDIADYILQFQTLSSQVRWNEAALVARFKEGLSPSVKRGLTSCWDTLTTMQNTQAKALVAYQNQEHLNRVTGHYHPIGRPRTQPYVRPQASGAPAATATQVSSATAMDLDQVRSRRLTPEQKEYRRQNKLCLYCGEPGHFANNCPKKIQLAEVHLTFDDDLGNATA
jgi:Retrotransposon gag protein/Zinc knuckle